ncbi:TetR/AcrR family transcriptional regulator [[Mycobacterium] crassicus]|uniref:TetR/AcrR family transcriptional regulator n=1 Tax=[Mycobacterium] crassicus TaxID=2872309 RepID=A0ABU5XGY1_9MYCO|nr:TetR/AcrR family transcriptional regulator [Mycolicibacter sp. MYC098]MEB3021418.1 TetR/AcrR family transcriptional regulator [Mycolicibacter sp. MYC098]
MTSQPERNVRDDLLRAAVGLLDEHGPDALQTRRVAGTAGTSTMAVYTHFGGMSQLIAAVADEGLRQFDAALTIPVTEDPVADLLATGIAYRAFAIDRPHLYRLMFGSTSAHGINAPARNMLTLSLAEIDVYAPSFAHLVHGVHRSIQRGRITVTSAGTNGSAPSDAEVVATAAQFWTVMHGFVMLELAGFFGDPNESATAAGPVLSPTATSLLVALGDTPERVAQSLAAVTDRP